MKFTLILSISLFIQLAKAQTPVRISPANVYGSQVAASGTNVIFANSKDIYISQNKQVGVKMKTLAKTNPQLFAGKNLVAFFGEADGKAKLFASNGGAFKMMSRDTSVYSLFMGAFIVGDELFWVESNYLSAGTHLYYSKNLGPIIKLTSNLKQLDISSTSIVYPLLQTKGYTYFKVGADTIATRHPDGNISYVKFASEMRSGDADGEDFVFVSGTSQNPILNYSVNGAAPVKIADLTINGATVAFIGESKIAVGSNNGIDIYQLRPAVVKLKTITTSKHAFYKKVNSGLMLMTSNPAYYYHLTAAGDTVRLSDKPDQSPEMFAVNNKYAAAMVRATPTSFPTDLKLYKDGVFQKNIVEAASGIFIDKFSLSESSVAWNQSVFTNTSLTGVYFYSFDNLAGVSGLEKDNAGFAVYPNPSKGSFSIDVEQALSGADISISDLAGRTVFKGVATGGNNEIENLGSGLYFINIKKQSFNMVRKVVVVN